MGGFSGHRFCSLKQVKQASSGLFGTAAQAGLISLNYFLPGPDGSLAAWMLPEEALVMRKEGC